MNSFVRLGIFSAILAAGLFAWNHFAPPQNTHPLSWGILAFFILITAFIDFLLTRPGRSPQSFVRTFMAVTTLKLFLFLLILVLYAFVDREGAFVFIFHFLVFYLLFTAFEVAVLMRHFRPKS